MRRLLAACLFSSPLFLANPAPAASSTIVISEFRARGPNGANDEFIELFNKSATTVNIGGYKIMVSDAAGTTSLLKQIPAATVMLPRHFYLLVNNGSQGYSGSTPPNTTYSVSIPDDGGIGLFTSANVVVDEVGMLPAPGDGSNNAYVEGTGLDPFDPIAGNVNQSYERNNGGCAATHDTDDNAIDFRFNATTSNPQNAGFNCNTCVGVTCVAPPNNQCWTSPGTCTAGSCSYTQHAVDSACSDGDACTIGDACDGAGTCVSGPTATCTTPPAPFCSDPQTLVTPSSTGTCGAATGCSYTQTSQNCPFGCNGSTKECNPDPCTNVSCTTPPNGCYAATGTCSSGTCIYAPLARNTSCSDGDACTTGDSCDGAGTCLPGASAVDDGNPCTTDSCAPATGVVSHVPAADGTACPDGDRCNGANTCQAGICVAGTPVTCNTPPIGGCYSSPGVCNSANGACTYAPRSASAACNDGDPCTQSDQCDGNGACGGSTVSCAANSVCLDSTTSRHEFGGACQSGSGACAYSHADETCAFGCDAASGLCNQDPCLGVNCPAPDQCHVGVCSGGSCGAIAKATGSACDDGDPCTNSDECSGAGACSGTPLLCNAPPAPACVSGASRTYAALGTCAAGSCDYGTPTDTACSNGCDAASGLCNADPCATLTCDQADQCHIGTCNGVCDYTTPKPDGSNCDDGNPCTVQDSCTGGVCVGEAKACNTPPAPNCVDPNTSRTYDASTTCDAIQGACSAYLSHDTNCPTGCDAATGVCNGDPCASMICNTAPGSCFLATGTCAAGVCSYGFVSAGVSCDDGNACTSGDQCDGAGRCLGTPSCAPEGGLGTGGTSSADATTSLDGGTAAGGTANTDASVAAGGSSVDGGVPSSDASQGGSSANGGASNGAGAGGISAGASSGTGGAGNGGEIGTLPDASTSDGGVNAAAAVQGDKGGCGCSIPGRTVETPWSLALAAVGLLVTRRRRRRA